VVSDFETRRLTQLAETYGGLPEGEAAVVIPASLLQFFPRP